MTRTCLIALAALTLAACGKDRPADGNQAFSDEDFTQSAIVANDVTAIDAATGDAANMAADLPPEAELGNATGDEAETAAPAGRNETRTRRPERPAREGRGTSAKPGTPAAEAPSPAPVPADGNSAG